MLKPVSYKHKRLDHAHQKGDRYTRKLYFFLHRLTTSRIFYVNLHAMKRYIDISMCFLLSLLIIQLGTGITMVQCLHHGEIMSVAEVEKKADDMNHGCHKPLSKCMTVKVSKLSPTSVAQSITHDFTPVLPLLFINDCRLIVPVGFSRLLLQQITQIKPHGPPLDYLHFIKVLII